MQFYDPKSSAPGERNYRIRLLGVNDANPTAQVGQGVVVTRTGEGAYLITWANNPGTFIGWTECFGALVPGDLKGYTAVRGVYSTTSDVFTMAFVTYNSSFSAADIIADQYADICVTFKECSA